MVDIQVKQGIKFKEPSAFISFPYNAHIVNLMRNQPIRYWHSDIKCWEVPYKNINFVISSLQENEYKLTVDNNITESVSDSVQVHIPEEYKFKTKPFEHQIAGIEYGLNHKKFLLADEQGLGKSFQMINLACINKILYGYKHCLIVACVNGLKYNWQEEVNIHSNETGYILGTRTTKKGQTIIGSNKDRLEDLQNIDKIKSYFIITNIETLRYNTTEMVDCKTKSKNGNTRKKKVTKFPIVEELQKLVNQGEISMIVADEIHRCLSKNVNVLTDKGMIPMEQIIHQQNFNVATMTDTGNIEFVKPVNYFTNPVPNKAIKLCIETKQGIKTIICTSNHKFLTHNRGYVEAQYLTENDDIVEV